jgi:hypothetical protein
MPHMFSRPAFLAALFVLSSSAAAGFVMLSVMYGDEGGGQVLLMTGTAALVSLIFAGLSLAAIVEVRRVQAEQHADELAEANERDNNIDLL